MSNQTRFSQLTPLEIYSPTDAEVITYDATLGIWKNAAGGGGGAPDDAQYLVGAANGDLSNEIVVGTNVATAIQVAVGSAGAIVVNGGVLGTPSSGTLTNATGLPISTGVAGLGTNTATALAVNVGSAGAVVVNGGALGTPSSGTLTNATGLPVSTGVSGLAANVATFLGTPSSANLLAAITDETGTGLAVFNDSPTFVDDIILGAAGVRLTGANGVLTILGLGDGSDEDLTISMQGGNLITFGSTTLAQNFDFNGTVKPTGDLRVGAGGYIYWNGRSVMLSPANGVWRMSSDAESVGLKLQANAPASIGGFGTGKAFVAGSTDSRGELDVGTITAETSGTVTFANTWTKAPECFVQNNTTAGAPVKATASTTVMTITGTFATGDNIIWWCVGGL